MVLVHSEKQLAGLIPVPFDKVGQHIFLPIVLSVDELLLDVTVAV